MTRPCRPEARRAVRLFKQTERPADPSAGRGLERNKTTGFVPPCFCGSPKPLGFEHEASGTLARAGGAEVGILRELSLVEYLGFTLKVAQLDDSSPRGQEQGCWAQAHREGPSGPILKVFFWGL